MSSVKSDVLAAFIDANGNYTYKYLSSPATSPLAWQQYTNSFTVPAGTTKMTVYHIIYSVGSLQTDDYSLTQNSNTQVSITSPSASQSLSGTANLTASATDSSGISSVQFQLDGQNLGNAVTTGPYGYSWDTTSATNGSHTLTAVATNGLGQTTTSAPVTVTVSNQSSGGGNSNPPNLLSNPGLETADPSSPTNPLGWRSGKWGTLTYSNTYLSTGHNSSHSVKSEITQYTSGAAYWYNLNQPVTAGQTYNFSDYYQSNTSSEVDVGVNMSDGTIKYIYLGAAAASPNSWTQFQKQFTTPAGAVSINIYHEIFSVGWLNVDDYSLTQDQTQVSITSPSASQSLSGTANLTASATDSSGISSVQFQLDGQNLGNAVTTGPYGYSWDTTSATNGSHTLTAVATNGLGQTTTSAPVTVTVSNQSSTANLITNPSFEVPNASNANKPAGWTGGSWGTNTATLSYLTGNAHSGTRSVEANITQYTSGAAHWMTNTIPVTPGQLYDYSEYYMSDTTTQVLAAFNMSDGTTDYVWLGSPFTSPNSWTKFRKQFTAPAGAISVNIFHELYSVGWVITDDYSLNTFAYQGFKEPIITITDDDGYSSFNQYGLPILNQYGYKSTDYIISSDPTRGPSYVNDSQIQDLYNSGQEIGSHTITHPDLTTLDASDLDNELGGSQAYLQNLLGTSVPNFASPYGSYNQQVLDNAKKYYRSFRTVDTGYNAKNNFDPYHIMVQNVYSTTTLAQFQSWVDEAKATNTWLVLVYHEVDPNATDTYNTLPTDFNNQLNVIKNSGIPVETMNQALDELTPQVN